MASSSQQHAVNIEKLSASMEEKFRMLPPLSSECCIYKVPNRMRVSKEQLFTPQVVSIGPIHYQNERLWANDHLKVRYLEEFLRLFRVSLKECFQHVSDNETKLRNCYADVIELDRENFVKMVLVDAAFLLMIILGSHFDEQLDLKHLTPRRENMIYEIKKDVMLLENQLPFFVLEDLYKLSKLAEETALTVFAYKFLNLTTGQSANSTHPSSKPKHILDLYRSYLMPKNSTLVMKETKTTNMPSMKELNQAGVIIQVVSRGSIFDIRFHDGILEIPPLEIISPTELLFVNLAAFEQCHYPLAENFFCNYIEMMRLLSLSSADVELLVQNGVINNGLSNDDEEVSRLFRNITASTIVSLDEFLYGDVIKSLNKYYKSCWHRWKATLKQKYFKAPWAICSVSAAVFLLVLTIVQTVLTILQFVLPK